jgi:hypothetical protein
VHLRKLGDRVDESVASDTLWVVGWNGATTVVIVLANIKVYANPGDIPSLRNPRTLPSFCQHSDEPEPAAHMLHVVLLEGGCLTPWPQRPLDHLAIDVAKRSMNKLNHSRNDVTARLHLPDPIT